MLTRLLLALALFLPAASAQPDAIGEIRILNRQILGRPDAELLRTRARLLEAEIRRHPKQAAQALFPLPDIERLRNVAASANDLETPDSAVTATVLIADTEDRSTASAVYLLDTPRGRVTAYQDASDAPPARCGDQVQVSGYRLGAVMAVTEAVVKQAGVPQPNCTPTGEHRAAVLLLKLPGLPDPPVTADQARTQFFSSDVASNNTFYLENSYGQANVTGDVFGPFTLDKSYTCTDTEAILAQAVQLASPTVDFSQYSHIHMLLPVLSGGCGWAGLASLGCRLVTAPGISTLRLGVVWQQVSRSYLLRESTHEMGHNFGLGHSRSVEFPGEPLGPDRTRAIYTEYGDQFSTMGGTDAYHFAMSHKAQLKWIADGDAFVTVSADGDFSLLPAESQSPGLKALRVRRALNQPNEFVWVEYRQLLGLFDGKMQATGWGGAMLHYESSETGLYAEALDYSPRPPGSPAVSFNDDVLATGRTWQDPYSPLTVTAVSAGDSLAVQVRFNKPCATVTWPSGTQLDAAGGVFMPAVAAPPDCAVTRSGNDSWLAPRSDGGFDVVANRAAFPRSGSVTVVRQTRFLSQTPPKTEPAVDFVSPSQGNFSAIDSVPFSIGVNTPNGSEMLRTVRVLIGASTSPANTCYVQFDVPNRRLALYNDAGNTLSPTLSVGAAGIVQNTQCVISNATLTFPSRTYAQLGFSLSTGALSGKQNIYAAADHVLDTTPAALTSQGTVTVTAAGCPAWFAPPRIDASGGGGTYSILQGSACTWTLSGQTDWATPAVTGGANSQRFNVTVKANTSASERTLMLQSGGTAFVIHQAAAGMPVRPQVSFANSEVRLARPAGSGTVYFNSNLPAAALAPASTVSWLRANPVAIDPVLGPTLNYSFDGNLDTQPRSGQVIVGGVALGFTQDGGGSGSGYLISTIAGTGDIGDGGPARNAFLGSPAALSYDSGGNLYIAETDFYRVRMVAADGSISTVAGSGAFGSSSDGTQATAALLYGPRGVAVDSKGNLYISDAFRIRKVTPDGTLSTVTSSLSSAAGLAIDGNDRLYVADQGAHRVRRVNADGSVTTVAGNGTRGYAGDGGAASAAMLNGPTALAFDLSGNLYIADAGNFAVRMISGTTIQSIAGTGTSGFAPDAQAAKGSPIGTPGAVAVDGAGTICFTENGRVRSIDASGNLATLAGGGGIRAAEGQAATRVGLGTPQGLAFAPSGQMVFADTAGEMVRALGADGALVTVAGSETWGPVGDGGAAVAARMYWPESAAVGPDGSVYVADYHFHRIRRITADGQIDTIAGDGTAGFAGDNGPAKAARLAFPSAVLVDPAGNVFVSDYSNARIRKITPDGRISTYAGNGRFGYADGPALSASINGVQGMALDGQGKLYLADTFNHRIRVVKADGTMSTVAGNGKAAFAGDGGAAADASLQFPSSVAVMPAGDLIIADRANRRIRRVAADGTISTIAGNGLTSGDSNLALNAALGAVYGIALTAASDILLADFTNNRIQRVGADGSISTIAGGNTVGFGGDGGVGWNAVLNSPLGVALDAGGNLIVADTYNNRIRLLQPQ
jgi:sugar lactone lactonase YvrE